ncbi:cyclase family protein [Streptomyces sp. NPDC050523]|uniref:cyclase family protein n=1 Tax=Streptomyces sp. NPDC050523 TaxID=3365622 RepID=UPI0037B9AB96
MLASCIVDLTHAFGPGQPRWSGFHDEQRESALSMENDGISADYHRLVGSWGTHVDAPAEMIPGGRTIDQLSPAELVLPLAVIDLSAAVAADPDRCLQWEDVKRWEADHGPIPSGSFVALRTDWSQRWPSQEAMRNLDGDGVAHTPGWTLEALRHVIVERAATAIGHETIDTDPGVYTSTDALSGTLPREDTRRQYACEAYVLDHDRYQVELLAHLDRVPALGAHIVVGVGKAHGGTAFPARVLALCPP